MLFPGRRVLHISSFLTASQRGSQPPFCLDLLDSLTMLPRLASYSWAQVVFLPQPSECWNYRCVSQVQLLLEVTVISCLPHLIFLSYTTCFVFGSFNFQVFSTCTEEGKRKAFLPLDKLWWKSRSGDTKEAGTYWEPFALGKTRTSEWK